MAGRNWIRSGLLSNKAGRAKAHPTRSKFISQEHSMSVVDVRGKTLQLKQVSDGGKEFDSFRIVK